MKSPEIKGANILLLGYGREGKSTHQFLLKNYPGITIGIADKHDATPIAPVAHMFTGQDYLHHLSLFDTVIRTPGIPFQTQELQAYHRSGGHVTSATNIFFSLVDGTTIGITGTKGKSTTSSLIHDILKTTYPDVRLVGNIGNPALDALSSRTSLPAKALATEGRISSTSSTSPDLPIFVIELSSHQLEDVHYSPHIAVLLNIVSEHLDYYKTMERYIGAKANIVKYQTNTDYIVFNPLHGASSIIAQSSAGISYQYAPSDQDTLYAWIADKKVVLEHNSNLKSIISLSEIPLKGNIENVLAAITTAAIMNIPPTDIRRAIGAFQTLPHRLEFVGEYGGIKFYNDSLATIPEATIHAVESLGGDVQTLIAGGFDRGLDYTSLGHFLAKQKGLQTLILFPDTGKKIKQAILASKGETIRSYDVTTMEEAVRLAYKRTQKGKICLLSPASASFNTFKDYADRGETFKKWVKELGKNA